LKLENAIKYMNAENVGINPALLEAHVTTFSIDSASAG